MTNGYRRVRTGTDFCEVLEKFTPPGRLRRSVRYPWPIEDHLAAGRRDGDFLFHGVKHVATQTKPLYTFDVGVNRSINGFVPFAKQTTAKY